MFRITYYKLILYGIIVGFANIIPGVSGGTMAVILNIYDKLINSISTLKTNPKKSLKFLVPFIIGCGIGILFLSSVVSYFLTNFNTYTNTFFIGIVCGSIPMLYKKSFNKGGKALSGIFFAVTLCIMLFMAMINTDNANNSFVSVLDVAGFFKILISSTLAGATMIMPGISGSLILLTLKQYYTVLNAISSFNIPILIPTAIGSLIGIFMGAKIIDKLFQKFPAYTYASIFGLVIGSIASLIPSFNSTKEVIISIISLCCGLILILWFSSDKRNRITRKKV